MSGNYGQSGYQNQGSDDCSFISPIYLTTAIDPSSHFIADFNQSQFNRGQSDDDYGSNNQGLNGGKKSQSSGRYGGQGGDTQGAYGGGDQCIPSFPGFLAWNAEMTLIRWQSDSRRLW